MKTCIFILPYFGKFNNYFRLFLKSCKYNRNYNWLIFTDDDEKYEYPPNVRAVYKKFEEIRRLFKEKIGDFISLEIPYKLCDYKPTYGFVFDEYIRGYDYWGHCDCDLLFGNISKILAPLLEMDYDKYFAAGHLTIYKNNKVNNMYFMGKLNGRYLYRDFLSTPNICWFDEDYKQDNIHSLFLDNEEIKVYSESMAFNPSGKYAFFRQRKYDSQKRCYSEESYHKALYLWDHGSVKRLYELNGRINTEEYLYIHLQHRKMRMKPNALESDIIQILPNTFLGLPQMPVTVMELTKINLEPLDAYLHIVRNIAKRLERKLKMYGCQENRKQ